MHRLPLGAPLAALAGVCVLTGSPRAEVVRLAMAVGSVASGSVEVALAAAGLMLVRGGPAGTLDGASFGWGMMVAAHAAAVLISPQSPAAFWLLGGGALLLGGIWPFTGSWLAADEGWGRRVGRGILAIHVLANLLPSMNPVAMDAWGPWAVFLPGVGVIWGGVLAMSALGQRSALALLWFFELQLISVFCLGARSTTPGSTAILLWAAVLPVALFLSMTPSSDGLPPRRLLGPWVSGPGLASLMAVPGAVGFPARFLAVSGLLATSPAGLVFYVVGLLAVPVFLRPLREEMRAARPALPGLIACCAMAVGIVLLGIAPGLAVKGCPAGLWGFLLGR
jgi:hypothetical protein